MVARQLRAMHRPGAKKTVPTNPNGHVGNVPHVNTPFWMSRELILLSPYKPPTQHPLILNNEDVAIYLNGYVALWHPMALVGAAMPPKVGSPYDYEQPREGQVFALPVSPPLYLPDDWEERVQKAG